VDISHGRKGQKRTFSVQKAEWLTMNRPSQHVSHRGEGTFDDWLLWAQSNTEQGERLHA
jgi:hypothetical protein